MANLDFYDSWRTAPKNALKNITAGNLKGKSEINPQWRIQVLTEKFGPVGFGWYTKITEHWSDTEVINGITERVAWVRLELYVKHPNTGEWSAAIEGIGGSKYAGNGRGKELNDETFKMAETDAISVACKKLGIAADVYWEKDKTKYSQTDTQQQQQQQPKKTLRPISMSDQDAMLRQLLGQWVAEGYTREGCEKTMNEAYRVTIPTAIWNEAMKVL